MRDTPRPQPTEDLDSVEEIEEMVRRFYADVAMDDVLGPVFEDVAQVDWSEHLPKLTAFWARALLGEPGYSGNPFRSHAAIHARAPFTPAHFRRWLTLFHETIELGWGGPRADRARELADAVARVHSEQLVGETVAIEQSSPTLGHSASSSSKRSGVAATS
ncbi:MAG: group III truncated hemoglobin [Acidimicrobiia bacterium]